MTTDPNFDKRYQTWLQQNPGGSFSEFFDSYHVPRIQQGLAHDTLGTNLKSTDWRTSGQMPFGLVQQAWCAVKGGTELRRDLTVCDYGCGTLRAGAHFMKHLNPGGYIGLDISQTLIDMGRTAWADLVADNRPLLGTVETHREAAITAALDVLFAVNVVCHVHPEEQTAFYDRIKSILHKPGSIAILHVLTHETPIRYQESGWAAPLETYAARMAPFRLHSRPDQKFKTITKPNYTLEAQLLTFERV